MLYWLIFTPIIIGILNAVFTKYNFKFFVLIAQVGLVLYTTYLFSVVKGNGPIINNLGQYPNFLSISLYADSMAVVLVWLSTILFFGVLLYAYHEEYFTNYFAFFVLILQALIMAIFLSTDLFNLYILIEVSTLVITVLIMFEKTKQSIYDGMLFLIITVVSSTFLLLGIGLLYRIFGYMDMYAISSILPELNDPYALVVPYGLILSALSLKLALFPLSSWLPRAYGSPSAPAGVPAILAGIYEMTSIYLFVRITSIFSQAVDVSGFFLVIGLITSILGFVFALGQNDMRRLLAYSTISQVGLMMVGLSVGTPESFWGSIFHMIAHSLFKMVLFLSSGVLSHYYETRSINKVKGVFKVFPLTGWSILFGLLGMTGAPFFNGSISKIMIGSGYNSSIVSFLLDVITFGTLLYSVKFASMLVGSNEQSKKLQTSKSSYDLAQWVTFIFGLLILFTGIFGNSVIELHAFDYHKLLHKPRCEVCCLSTYCYCFI